MKGIFCKVVVALCAIATFFFTGCTNSAEEISKLSADEALKPLNVQYDVAYNYSDSARQRLALLAPIVSDFSHADEPYYEFREGIDVTFFDTFGEPESYLKADYAKQLIEKDMWEARGDVVVRNKKGEQLNTEHLIWNVKEEKITSDVFVKITTADEVIMGEGFEADQNFTSYKLKGKVRGELKIKDVGDE